MTTQEHHPNAMIYWPDIACQRGHDSHVKRCVAVTLGGPTGYQDLPEIPQRLARSFAMDVYDPDLYPVDGGLPGQSWMESYCPAHDAVSATICSHGVWEPRETILMPHACEPAPAGSVVWDIGAQIGWYSLLAASCGVQVLAMDADPANLSMLATSALANGWGDEQIHPDLLRIGSETGTLGIPDRVRVAKLDIEGAEADAIRMMEPALAAERVDFLLMEVSPCFAPGYPELVANLCALHGFEAFMLPPKHLPPISMENPREALAPYRLPEDPADIEDQVASWAQEDLWFARIGAEW